EVHARGEKCAKALARGAQELVAKKAGLECVVAAHNFPAQVRAAGAIAIGNAQAAASTEFLHAIRGKRHLAMQAARVLPWARNLRGARHRLQEISESAP